MSEQKLIRAFEGSLVADALSMPVHWYYDTQALLSEYGPVDHFMAPKNPHTGSILWRSKYESPNEKGDILREQAQYWGQSGIHYHQFLQAGENTLNFQLARELYHFVLQNKKYSPEEWAQRYIECMLTPGWHRDTYIEEYHRGFFFNYAQGKSPMKCGIKDIHIGGLATVPALVASLVQVTSDLTLEQACEIVRRHVSLTHKDNEVLDAAETLTKLLWALSEGQSLQEALQAYATDWFSLSKAKTWSQRPNTDIVGKVLSPACYIRDSMPGALYLAWKYSDDFTEGLIANTMVGGENCHRGAVVGSLLAAENEIPNRLKVGIQRTQTLQRALKT